MKKVYFRNVLNYFIIENDTSIFIVFFVNYDLGMSFLTHEAHQLISFSVRPTSPAREAARLPWGKAPGSAARAARWEPATNPAVLSKTENV